MIRIDIGVVKQGLHATGAKPPGSAKYKRAGAASGLLRPHFSRFGMAMRTTFPLVMIAVLLGLVPGAAQQVDAPSAPAAVAGGSEPARATWQAAPAPFPVGVPVVLGRDTVLTVRSRVGSFTPAERAAAIERRLTRLARDPYVRADAVQIVVGESSSDIMVGDELVMTVTEADAAALRIPRAQMTQTYAVAIRGALVHEGFVAKARTVGLGMLFALMATLTTVIIFRLVQRVFPRLAAWVEGGRTTWIPTLRIQNLELLGAGNIADALLWVLGVLRMGVLTLLLYVSLPIILSFFPWTERYADRLFGYIINPFAAVWASFIAYVPDLFRAGAVVVVTWYMLKLVRLFFDGMARGNLQFSGFYQDWAIPTYKIVRFVVIVFAFIAIWPYLPGSDSKAFQGVGVLLGLLISFGSASAISNVVGGVVLTYMRPFRVGDRVKIADTMGDVVEKNLLVTRIRTVKNVDITVPNSMVLSSHIVNYSSTANHHGLILNTTVTIGYDVPWRQVHELLITAAAGTPGILAEPAPFVLQTSLDDFYVSYELNAYTDRPNRMAVLYSGLHANIQDRFNEAGVEIMSPHYRAPRDGNPTTIPAQYLPADYRAPAFRIATAGRESPLFSEPED